MDQTTKGAWLLAHSKRLDAVQGLGRLDKIAYAGKIGRLYNILRRGAEETKTTTINKDTVEYLARLNNIDLATRQQGLQLLSSNGRLDVAEDGSVAVLGGGTSRSVLETTAGIFDKSTPEPDEKAILDLSNLVAEKPAERTTAEEYVQDTYKISAKNASGLLDTSVRASLIDQESHKDKEILFNGIVFRDSSRAAKAYFVLESLKSDDGQRLNEITEEIQNKGAVHDSVVRTKLGQDLYRRLCAVGFFDTMQVENERESITYVTMPDSFQRYGRPFQEDPVDDAKALLASLTYGMTRSSAQRGKIQLPDDLLRKLVRGEPVGPVRAIGHDYRELERRGVVQVFEHGRGFSMTLLKKDVGVLARQIIKGQSAAEQTLLLGAGVATGFKEPEAGRLEVRQKNTIEDKAFTWTALERIRSGD